jgi:hypothetical protein
MKSLLDKNPNRHLSAADLCDRCSARAMVETVMMPGNSLLWCAHHFAFFEEALDASGAAIRVDERPWYRKLSWARQSAYGRWRGDRQV